MIAELREELRRKPYKNQKAVLWAIVRQLESEWRQYQADTLALLDDTTPF